MVNEILSAITKTLRCAFEGSVEIYTTDVPQGLRRPAFFVSALAVTRRQLLGARFLQKNPFEICYYPKKGATRRELIDIGEALLSEMHVIKLPSGASVRGSDCQYEIKGGVLHFSVSYNLHLYTQPDTETMETLTVLAASDNKN